MRSIGIRELRPLSLRNAKEESLSPAKPGQVMLPTHLNYGSRPADRGAFLVHLDLTPKESPSLSTMSSLGSVADTPITANRFIKPEHGKGCSINRTQQAWWQKKQRSHGGSRTQQRIQDRSLSPWRRFYSEHTNAQLRESLDFKVDFASGAPRERKRASLSSIPNDSKAMSSDNYSVSSKSAYGTRSPYKECSRRSKESAEVARCSATLTRNSWKPDVGALESCDSGDESAGSAPEGCTHSGSGSELESDLASEEEDVSYPARKLSSTWSLILAPGRKNRKEPKRHIRLLASVFEGRPPTIFFEYTPACGAKQRDLSRVMSPEDIQSLVGSSNGGSLPKMYFSQSQKNAYNCVRNTMRHAGLHATSEQSWKWCVRWGPHPTPDKLRVFNPCQKANHFPSSWHLGRKDLLARHITRMKRQWPSEYDIFPQSFCLPADSNFWENAREADPKGLWIWKPVASSCGRGIKILSSQIQSNVAKELSKKTGIVQRYISNPLLINGYKFDLRLYVIVSSYDPLKIYLNAEGLVRIATEKFSKSKKTLHTRTMHLTNYSVNKQSEKFVKNFDGTISDCTEATSPQKDSLGEGEAESDSLASLESPLANGDDDIASEDEQRGGSKEEDSHSTSKEGSPQAPSKWSLTELKEHFLQEGLDYDLMMKRVKDLVVKSIISAEQVIVTNWHRGASFQGNSFDVGSDGQRHGLPNQTCFEVYGFDILIDKTLHPWLLEVNVGPSLSSSSPLDKRVKTQLIADTLTLAGLRPFDHQTMDLKIREEQASRTQGYVGVQGLKSEQSNRRDRFKSTQELASLEGKDALNCLSEAEWQLILDAHDEDMRCGALERIFPLKENAHYYSTFLSTSRHSNLVLRKWLEAGGPDVFRPDFPHPIPDFVPKQSCFTKT